jgi:uncharacterized protein
VTLAIDPSALVKRYLREPGRDLVITTMEQDPDWCASALTRTEVLIALHRSAISRRQQQSLWATFRDDWDAMVVVPVDDRCLGRAVEIGAGFGIRTVDAIHLAAADRLPRPTSYLTFDRQQIPAAAALGFEVVSPMEA